MKSPVLLRKEVGKIGGNWIDQAYDAAVSAGKEGRAARRKWAGQNAYDQSYMRTESTRFTRDQDEELRRCCKEAGVTRYTLIAYLLRAWMAAWQTYQGRGGI